MRVKDFTAEILSEIADDAGYLVYKYECSSPSNGSIVFEIETTVGDEESYRYKVLNYSDHMVTLVNPLENAEVDLHEPESVDDIEEWFDDLTPLTSFDSPLGLGLFTTTWASAPYTTQQPYTITTTPPYSPITHVIPSVFSPLSTGITIGSGTATYGSTLASGITINNANKNIFSISSGGLTPLGP